MATIHMLQPTRTDGEMDELLQALVLLLTTFSVDPDSTDDQAEAFENGIQAVEKAVGMPFCDYLQTLD